MSDKKDWEYFREWLAKDFRPEHDYERLQVELDAWAAYLEQNSTELERLRKENANLMDALAAVGVEPDDDEFGMWLYTTNSGMEQADSAREALIETLKLVDLPD